MAIFHVSLKKKENGLLLFFCHFSVLVSRSNGKNTKKTELKKKVAVQTRHNVCVLACYTGGAPQQQLRGFHSCMATRGTAKLMRNKREKRNAQEGG